MAYTKIHPIKVTLGKAIDYVCKFEKTGNGQYFSSVNCQYNTAEPKRRSRKNYYNAESGYSACIKRF